jgi:predicted Zn-dependent peptidase
MRSAVASLSLSLLTFLVAPAALADTPPHVAIAAQRSTLDNGLELLVEENHRSPLVGIQLAYKVGSADDPPGRKGMARLVRDLLADPSTRHVARKVQGELFRALSVDRWPVSTDVGLDRTTVTFTVPTNELELALWWESDQMGFGLDGMDQPSLTEHRDAIERQRQSETERQAYGALPSIVRNALWPAGHPYQGGVNGAAADLASVSVAELRAFVRSHYAPGNATLVLVGDVDAVHAKELVTKYFGPVAKQPAVTRTTAAPVTLDGEKRVAVEAHVDASKLIVAWPSPALFAEGDTTLDATYHLLTDPHRGRLVKRLVTEAKVATEVTARQRSWGLGSQFEIDVVLAAGHTPDEALKLVDEEIDRLKGSPPTDVELAAVRQELVRNTAFGSETMQSRAAQIGYFTHHRGDPTFVDKYLASYAGLSAGEVQRIVSSVLATKKRVVVSVTPNGTAPVGGRVVGGGS